MRELNKLASSAQEQSRLRAELHHDLEKAQQVVALYRTQRDTILRTANAEMVTQYQRVLAYANYLDEHIARNRHDTDLRYDFDDVCESGFNLKLIAGALDMLRREIAPNP